MNSCFVLQTFGISEVAGAAWIGLNSVANPFKKAWEWVGGQKYDPAVQVRI